MGPRNPLGQDPVALDYSYDSDAEWEDEDPNDGDDVQDVDEKEEDEGGDDDSEMDDWLVDDLEEEEDDGSVPPDDLDVFGSSVKMDLDMQKPFGKATSAKPVTLLQPKKKKIKPIGRRFEKKLVPFATGPHWENVLGECSYDGFENYQMEFINGEHCIDLEG
jgi:chromatin assembly factor 1 subunit A